MNSGISEKLQKFFERFKEKNYKKGEILIDAAAIPPGLFCLKQGVVRQYSVNRKGNELNINMFREGSLFPVAWVLNDSTSPYYFEALTAVSVWIAPKKEALEFLQTNNDVLLDLIKRIYRGLDGYFQRLEHLALGSARSRLVIEIVTFAKRFGLDFGKTTQINLKLTEKDLSSETGIARETVSRELKKLKEKGLINFSKNVLIVLDLPKLEEELS